MFWISKLFESNKSREYETFKSPIKGYIFDLIPSSPGYSASSGEVLLKIVLMEFLNGVLVLRDGISIIMLNMTMDLM